MASWSGVWSSGDSPAPISKTNQMLTLEIRAAGVGLVAHDVRAAAFRDHVAGAGERRHLARLGKHKDAVIAAPLAGQPGIVLKDVRRVGKVGSVPEVRTAAVQDVDRTLEIEGNR